MSEINVTNLVDVVLVLLIIFMIAAPMLQSGIDINLPKTRTAISDDLGEGVVLTIDNKGGIFIDDVWVRLPDFTDRLDEALQQKNSSSVYVRADSAVIYAVVVDVIAKIKDMGIDYLGLVTSPVDTDKLKK
ncbi:MAG: biopolymer transporter ExbD [candidate division Zixibacteria bacterium]|nr:biopolymer transporter ExbD [candidate division Zixibacteria bacterium]